MQMKVFDLDTARETLVVIKPIVEEINAKRVELTEAYERFQEEQDTLERMYLESHIKDLEAVIDSLFRKIEALGGGEKGYRPHTGGFLELSQKQIHLALLEGGRRYHNVLA
jgi:Uncharacterized conserved protein (DUF2203).